MYHHGMASSQVAGEEGRQILRIARRVLNSRQGVVLQSVFVQGIPVSHRGKPLSYESHEGSRASKDYLELPRRAFVNTVHKRRGISRAFERMSDSQEGFCSVELVITNT